jgi:hypothetical protein
MTRSQVQVLARPPSIERSVVPQRGFLFCMTGKEGELKSLRKKRDGYVDQMMWFALSLIVIFGLPAGIAVYLGKVVFENTVVLTISLISAFVLSWLIVIYRYKKIAKKVRETEDAIQEIQEK